MRALLGSVVIASTVACGSAPEFDPAEADVGSTAETVLAEVATDDWTLTFVESDDTVLVIETSPGTVAGPLDRLKSDQPPTVLEIFQAVTEAEPPAAIFQAHVAQATAFGRADAETVLGLEFDAHARVPKNAECTAYVFGAIGGSTRLENSHTAGYSGTSGGTSGLNFGPAFSFASIFPVALGICNANQNNVETRYRYDRADDPPGWVSSSWIPLSTNVRRRYYPVHHHFAGVAATKYALSWRGPGGINNNANGHLAIGVAAPNIR